MSSFKLVLLKLLLENFSIKQQYLIGCGGVGGSDMKESRLYYSSNLLKFY